ESDGGELAGRLLGQLLLQVETLGDAQFAVPIFQAAAAYALWHGDLVDARRAVARAWEMTRVTEDWALAAKLAATVARVDDARVARTAARGPLLESFEIARELGARPLMKELRELGRRALITLPEPTVEETSAPSETVGGRAALGGHDGAEVPASSATDRNG